MIPKLPFGRYIPSRQLISGAHINALTDMLTGTATNITATAGGTQATSIALSSAFNEITTVATDEDGVLLPPAKSGLRICITNSGENSAQVFGNGTDTINGTAGNVGVALDADDVALFICTKDGVWRRFVSS